MDDDMEEISLKDADGYVEISDIDLIGEHAAVEKSYASMAADTAVYIAKGSFVYSVKTIGGCFTGIAIAPRALPLVAAYLLPTTALPGTIAAETVRASLGVVGFGIGSQVCKIAAEATWDLSSVAVNKTITYVFSNQPSVPLATEIKPSEKIALVPKHNA